jgi:hypothetical protein
LKTEADRRKSNYDRVLEYLQVRHDRGATNGELLNVGGFRYGARIYELRKAGWIIETRPLADGEYRFILKGKLQDQSSLFAEMAR